MGNIFSKVTESVKALPRAVTKTVNEVAKAPAQLAQMPAKATAVVRDTVQLSSKPQRAEVNRRQVSQAARSGKNSAAPAKTKVTPDSKSRNSAAPMSLEVIREASPAQQRAYFQRVKAQKQTSVASHSEAENKKVSPNWEKQLAEVDQVALEGVGKAWNATKDTVGEAGRKALGTEGIHQADLVAQNLQQKKVQRFENRLGGQDAERYARYKKIQLKDEKQLASEASSETWKRRDLQLEEEARSRNLLAKDPSHYTLSERHQSNVRRAEKSIVDGNFRESWHRADAALEQKTREQKTMPNKAAWLKSLSPEARAEYLQREKVDNASIEKSAVESKKNADNIYDTFSLGTGKTIAEDGLGETLLEIGTVGIYSAAKTAGTDLGRGGAYAEHADSLKEAGLHLQAAEANKTAAELNTSGAFNLVMAGASAWGVGKFANTKITNYMKSKLSPLPKLETTVATRNRALAGTTRPAGSNSASALDFEGVVDQARRSGLQGKISVKGFRYQKQPWYEMSVKPEWKKVAIDHHITVNGAEHDFMKRVGNTFEDLPEASYHAVEHVDNIHVGDFAEFVCDEGKVTSGLQGTVGRNGHEGYDLILNRRTIDSPLNKQMDALVHENGRRLAKRSVSNSFFSEAADRERQALLEMADEEMRKTVWHEVGHVHDDLLKISQEGVFNSNSGRAYSRYAAETGDAGEDLAEGYAHVLEERRRILNTYGKDADWRGVLRNDPELGRKNSFILDYMLESSGLERSIKVDVLR